jgi:predicted hydrolase (HD superfamily)
MTRDDAWALLTKYNKDPFHLRHALTVEAVMRWFAGDQGFGAEADFWADVGMLHDIDFEMWPDQHCKKAPELLKELAPVTKPDELDRLIHAVCSHGYGICSDVQPEHQMEKVLFACDELTGLVWSASLVRPSKSVQDMDIKSIKKKFKTPSFAAGCSREVIQKGADGLGWTLDELFDKTLQAMKAAEPVINDELKALG